MKYNAISNSEKFWEVIYASIMLEGEEREEALKRLQVPANPAASATEHRRISYGPILFG